MTCASVCLGCGHALGRLPGMSWPSRAYGWHATCKLAYRYRCYLDAFRAVPCDQLGRVQAGDPLICRARSRVRLERRLEALTAEART